MTNFPFLQGPSLVESISEINNEEGISPQQIDNNLNTNGPLVEETGQPYIGDIVSKIDAPEEHQESSEFCVECTKQQEHHSETQHREHDYKASEPNSDNRNSLRVNKGY